MFIVHCQFGRQSHKITNKQSHKNSLSWFPPHNVRPTNKCSAMYI